MIFFSKFCSKIQQNPTLQQKEKINKIYKSKKHQTSQFAQFPHKRWSKTNKMKF